MTVVALDPYADAVRYLERLLGPCDPGPGDGDHQHRQCRRCLAIARLEVHDRFARRCLRTALMALQQVQAATAIDAATQARQDMAVAIQIALAQLDAATRQRILTDLGLHVIEVEP